MMNSHGTNGTTRQMKDVENPRKQQKTKKIHVDTQVVSRGMRFVCLVRGIVQIGMRCANNDFVQNRVLVWRTSVKHTFSNCEKCRSKQSVVRSSTDVIRIYIQSMVPQLKYNPWALQRCKDSAREFPRSQCELHNAPLSRFQVPLLSKLFKSAKFRAQLVLNRQPHSGLGMHIQYHFFYDTHVVIHIHKAGPVILIRIRINIVFVLNTSYCVFEPYLSYLTVEKYDFSSKYVFPKIRITTVHFTFI